LGAARVQSPMSFWRKTCFARAAKNRRLFVNGNLHPLHGRPARLQAIEARGLAETATDDASGGCRFGRSSELVAGSRHPSAVALECVAVYLDADAGVLRDPHLAVRDADSAAYEVLAEGV
jgi:hypothetical protein